MLDVCKLFKEAITDEIVAQEFYEKLKKNVSKEDKWKISEIQSEEHIHQQELKAISKRLKCNI